jgi:hypothetical protein
METQTEEIVTPRKSRLPLLLGIGLVILIAAAAFVAARYAARGKGHVSLGGGGNQIVFSGPSGAQQTFSLNITPSKELPQTQPEAIGIFVERKDNSIFIGTGEVNFTFKKTDANSTPVTDSSYNGDKVEVVVSANTKIYRDTTKLDPDHPDAEVQQTVELGTIDGITPQSSITVWGKKAGDRVVASVIIYTSPFAFKVNGAP